MTPTARVFHPHFALALCLSLAAPGTIWAQEADAEDEATQQDQAEEAQAAAHFTNGRRLYAEGKLDAAVAELLKAYQLRPAPPILLNVARTREKQGNKVEALKYYKEFLQKARLVDPNRPQVEAVVKKLEAALKATPGVVAPGAATPGAATPGATPEAAGGVEPAPGARSRRQQLIHTPVDSARVNQPITVMAELPPRTEADRVALYVRSGGETRFHEITMELQGETYIARIPGSLVTSTSLQYFIQAHASAAKGSVVAVAGTKTAPHIVVIEGGRAPTLGPVEEIDVHSPYRTWVWLSAGASVAFLGGGLGFALLAGDRESAMERWSREQSCDAACQAGNSPPRLTFDNKARDWETEGQTFALLGKLFIGLGVASGLGFGALLYLDRKYVREERRRQMAGAPPRRRSVRSRATAAPWANRGGAGVLGQITF